MRLLWLPQVLRAAGLTVHEVPGWRTRGSDEFGPVRGITCHHTAGSRSSTDDGEISVLLNGSASAPPPIAQLYLSRSGEWWVVASGRCNHNLTGWGGPNAGYGNSRLLGIEAQHSGGDEPWTDRQYDSYVRGVAALVRHEAPGWDVTVARVAGHREHQPGAKSDPTFDMGKFRAHVSAARLNEGDDVSEQDVIKALQSEAGKAAIWAAFNQDRVQGYDENGVALPEDPKSPGDNDMTVASALALSVRFGRMTEAQVRKGFGVLRQAIDSGRIDYAKLSAQLAPALGAYVLANLPAGQDDISQDEVDQAVSRAFAAAFGPKPS